MLRKRNNDLLQGLYYLLFLSIWVFLFWKCRYGLSNMDESFYLTIPYRFCQGDKPFLHEWHMSQTSGLLLVPLMKLYLAIFHSTEGICLHFRWIFTFVWGFAALFFYFRLRVFSDLGAMLSSLVFLIYTPLGIMALSYNTLGILLLLSVCVTIASAHRHLSLQFFLSGLLLALAVLCCPHLIFLYFAFCLLALFRKDHLLRRCWLFVTLGSGLVFLLFCSMLLLNAPVSEYLSVIPALLSDPEHPTLHLPTKILILITSTWEMNHATIPITILVILISVLARKTGQKTLGFSAASILSAYLLFSYWYINHYMFPLTLLGFYCHITEKKDPHIRKLFHAVWVPGILYAFCIHLSSNQNFQAFTSAATVSTVASTVIACRFVQLCITDSEEKAWKKACPSIVLALLLSFQFYRELSARYQTVYWESGMDNQTVLAEEGPQKGILMNIPIYEYYLLSEQDVDQLCSDPSIQKVLFLTLNNWLYLSAEKELSTFSVWLSNVNETTISRLDTYFGFFPEKMPDAIFIDRDYTKFISHYKALGYHIADYSLSEYAVILVK